FHCRPQPRLPFDETRVLSAKPGLAIPSDGQIPALPAKIILPLYSDTQSKKYIQHHSENPLFDFGTQGTGLTMPFPHGAGRRWGRFSEAKAGQRLVDSEKSEPRHGGGDH